MSEESQVRLQARLAAVETADEALALLKESGASPIEAIKALRDRFAMSLTEAKMALHRHSSWAKEAAAADRLHDELEAILDDLKPGG